LVEYDYKALKTNTRNFRFGLAYMFKALLDLRARLAINDTL